MTKLFRLTLHVLVDLNGEPASAIERLLNNLPMRAAGEGLFTGDTDANVVEYGYTVTQPKSIEDTGEDTGHDFVDCGGVPRCSKCGCDEDDAFVGGEPCNDEQQRRDEKNGLYGEHDDVAN